jgi:DnaJ-class molecular chaperone
MSDSKCSKCGGSGKVVCQGCGGTGRPKDDHKEQVRWASCAGCHGTGQRTCAACGGTGMKRTS